MARRRNTVQVKIVQPKRSPNEIPWEPSHNYDCSNGHHIHADAPVAQCPAAVEGQPCGGSLRAVGKGSGRGSHLRKAG